MKIYVYTIYFPTSKRLNSYYVGVSDNLERRMLEHFNSKYLVGNALDKYNDWIIKKLHTCKTYEEAFRVEIEEIRNFNCVALNGYNLTRGGDGGPDQTGYKHSKESKEKNRQAHLGKESGFEGHHHTKETIEKIVGANLGNKNAKGVKHPELIKRNKENRGKKYSKEVNKKKGSPGNQYALKDGKHTKDAKIKRLKTRIAKLEQDL